MSTNTCDSPIEYMCMHMHCQFMIEFISSTTLIQFLYHLDIIQLMWYFNNYLDIIIVFMLFNVCYISLKTQFYIIFLSTLSTNYIIICQVPTLNPIFCSIPIKCFIILLLNEWITHIFSNVSWIRPKHLQVTSDNMFRRKLMNYDHVGNALTTCSNLKTKSILRCVLTFLWQRIFLKYHFLP